MYDFDSSRWGKTQLMRGLKWMICRMGPGGKTVIVEKCNAMLPVNVKSSKWILPSIIVF
jgi:hypothetical protein